ncbi:MAG TPA: hypothetical protein VGO93_23695 [Candidatus Xenobia bacterium]
MATRRDAADGRTYEGHRIVALRLEDQVFELARQKAEREHPPGVTGPGRTGGISSYIRRLIHRDLGLPDPEPYAPTVSPRRQPRQKRNGAGPT